jgi:hypothetical protein
MYVCMYVCVCCVCVLRVGAVEPVVGGGVIYL